MPALNVPSLSRRELQLLAKELQLCRGNAKSDVIMQHVYEFVAANPSDGEQRVIALVGASSEAVKAAAPEDEKPSPAASKADEASPSPNKAASNDSDATDSDSSSPKNEKSPEKANGQTKHADPQPERMSKSPKSGESELSEPVAATKSDSSSAKALPSPSATAATKRRRAEPAAPSDSSEAKASGSSTAVSTPTASSSRKQRSSTPPAAKAAEPKVKTIVASENEQKPSSIPSKTDASTATTAPRRALASIENSTADAPVPADVSAFVAAADDLEFTKDGRVRCSTTAHEMKADLAVIKEHLRGKRYARARGLKRFSLEAYAPMFSEHPDEKLAAKLVWCDVTETVIVRSREQIEAHIAGPRYQKELPQWKEEQAAKAKAEAEAAARAEARKLAFKKRKSEAQADGKSAKRRAAASS